MTHVNLVTVISVTGHLLYGPAGAVKTTSLVSVRIRHAVAGPEGETTLHHYSLVILIAFTL